MKRSDKAVALTMLGLLLLAAVPAQQVRAQVAYSESLNVDIAGSSAYWFMTFQGINSSSSLASFEATPGLSWYNITVIDTTSWLANFQTFGPDGYNLIPVPFLPQQGAFLTVGSDSFGDASAAALALDSYLLTAFVSYSNSTGAGVENFTFYSPLAFTTVVPKTLLTMIPTTEGGFTSALTVSAFDSTGSPMVTLEGVKSSSTFDRSLIVGSISNGALNGKDEPQILTLYGSSLSYLAAGNKSTSSSIDVRVLDGLTASSDKATVVDDNASMTSTYTLQLQPGEKVYSLNATVVEAPAELLAYRTVSPANLVHGEDLTVTDTLYNLSPTYAISISDFTDNWWNQAPFSGLFRLVSNTTFPTSIGNGTTTPVTPVYVLQYIGNATEQVTIPGSAISYSFTAGGKTFLGESTLNQVPLSLGLQDADIFSYVKATPDFVPNVGQSENLTVVAVNEGNRSASSVTVAGVPEPGLAAQGGTASVNITQVASGLIGLTQPQSYSVSYANPMNTSQILSTSSNSVRLYFSRSTLDLGLPKLTILETISRASPTSTKLVLNFTVTNTGNENLTSFEAEGALPQGLGCGIASNSSLTCSSDAYQLSYAKVAEGVNESVLMTYNITKPSNYVVAPATFDASSEGFVLSGWSSPLALPTGLVAYKTYALSGLFPGMNTDVNITADNAGPFGVYNATISSTADPFDKISGTAAGSATYSAIMAGQTKTISYTVNTTSVSGPESSSDVAEDFYFGGTLFDLQTPGPSVSVYKTLNATVTTVPASPIEGQAFKVEIVITNPSGANVTGVSLVLPFQSGTALSQATNGSASGTKLTVTAASLEANSTADASVEATAPSGAAIDFASATLTFSYGGVKLTGSVTSESITVGENVTVRYYIPIAIAILALLGTAFYVRRKAFPIAPASQK